MEKTQGRPYYGPFLSIFSIRCFSIPGGFTLGSASSASNSSIGIGFDGIKPVDSVRSFASNFAVDTVRRMLLAAWIAYRTFMPLFIIPDATWSGFLVPTLEGQYIIKNLVVIATAIGIIAHLHPLPRKFL
jgi:hypothetical protein